MMDVEQIRAVLPHRYPFLLVDKILEVVPGKSAKGYKNVTINEEFFQGHFPGHAVMPGVLILESMAQVAGVLLLSSTDNSGKLALFAGMEKVRFRNPVLPGDVLTTEVEVICIRGAMAKVKATSTIGDKTAAEGEFTFVLADN